uniref:Uncharacterized protein n=1 Tax=Timema genevievae TaxID=629358 RepID=A0A7R9JRR6_TIMGE|nr:unnamed protein product [Timema genevievae]
MSKLEPQDDTLFAPPPYRSPAQTFFRFLYNRDEGTFLGRTGASWGYGHACDLDAATRSRGMLFVATGHTCDLVAAFYDQLSWHQGVNIVLATGYDTNASVATSIRNKGERICRCDLKTLAKAF